MRRNPEAFCTTVLIVINVAVFLILSMLGDTEDAAFINPNVLSIFIKADMQDRIRRIAKLYDLSDAKEISLCFSMGRCMNCLLQKDREYYRIFTCMFLHFGITHLMNNMVML